ncbi:MAG: hypothetical protein AB7L71_18775 [Vicinamibacterales bacterium]
MTCRSLRRGIVWTAVWAICAAGLGGEALSAQRGRGGGGRGGAAAQPPRRAREAAPVDLTGYWVAVITEDWRFRMTTAPVGDTASVPLNQAGIAAAKGWTPAADLAAGEQCRPFGAAGIMRLPVRLHITWQDDATLKVEIDNGSQTRLFHFDRGTAPPDVPGWQGFSLASWETVGEQLGLPDIGRGGGGGAAGVGQGAASPSGALKVVTTRMRPGYLRRNGVPYSANAVYTEFFDRMPLEPNGDTWLVITSVVEDPQYLTTPFLLTTHFKREADGAKFRPRPCEITAPLPQAR